MQRQANDYTEFKNSSLIAMIVTLLLFITALIIILSLRALAKFFSLAWRLLRKFTVRVFCFVVGHDETFQLVTAPKNVLGITTNFPSYVICKCKRCNKTF